MANKKKNSKKESSLDKIDKKLKKYNIKNTIESGLKPGDMVTAEGMKDGAAITKHETGESTFTPYDPDDFVGKLEYIYNTLLEEGVELWGLPLRDAYKKFDEIMNKREEEEKKQG